MYTGADTCCQLPYALAVTCDHPQHPLVIYDSAGINMEAERAELVAPHRQATLRYCTYRRDTAADTAAKPQIFVFRWGGAVPQEASDKFQEEYLINKRSNYSGAYQGPIA